MASSPKMSGMNDASSVRWDPRYLMRSSVQGIEDHDRLMRGHWLRPEASAQSGVGAPRFGRPTSLRYVTMENSPSVRR